MAGGLHHDQASSPINISFIAELTDKRAEPGLDKLITAFHPVLSSLESFRIQERRTIQSGAIEEVDQLLITQELIVCHILYYCIYSISVRS